jgi:hypothetical protein
VARNDSGKALPSTRKRDGSETFSGGLDVRVLLRSADRFGSACLDRPPWLESDALPWERQALGHFVVIGSDFPPAQLSANIQLPFELGQR